MLQLGHKGSRSFKSQIGFLLLLFVFSQVSPCSSGRHGTYYVDQAGLELIEIHLPLPPYPVTTAFSLQWERENSSEWSRDHSVGQKIFKEMRQIW